MVTHHPLFVLCLLCIAKFNFERLTDYLYFSVFELGQRHDDMELATGEVDFVIARAFNPDAPAMSFDNTFGSCQAQPGTAAFEARLTSGVFAEFTWLIEFGKDHFTQVRVDTHAGITDDDLNTAVGQVDDGRDMFAGDRDPAFVGCEFDRVADKVVEQFLE